MRRDPAFVDDIFRACNEIQRLCSGRSADEAESDPTIRAALLHQLTVIGEAANRLSDELRAAHPSIPWPDIVSQRNRIVHGYFGLDWGLVWHSATRSVPDLKAWAEAVLREELREGGD
ncbi:MAG TPA: HepT-like ribonuclease domain-containing protein [Bryobacteraceae bacterium]